MNCPGSHTASGAHIPRSTHQLSALQYPHPRGLWGSYYCPHFTDEETEVEELSQADISLAQPEFGTSDKWKIPGH